MLLRPLPRRIASRGAVGVALLAWGLAGPIAAQQSLPWVDSPASAPALTLQVQEWGFGAPQAAAGKSDAAAEAPIVGSATGDGAQLGAGRLLWDSRKAEPRQEVTAQATAGWARRLTWGEAGLAADVQAVPIAGGMRIQGLLRNLHADTATTRRLTLQLLLAFGNPATGAATGTAAASNGVWLQDAHTTRALATGEEQYFSFGSRAGARGSISRYPFGAVALADGAGWAAGFPLDRPCVHRLRYDPADGALVAELDVALSPLPTKFPNAAPFEFLVYGFDGRDGFRGALQHYQALHGAMFRARMPRQGLWMPFTQVDKVKRPEDFRFAFHEYHPDVSTAYNGRNGILSLIYCEPPVQYIDLPAGTPRTMESFLATLAGLRTERAQVVRTSGAYTGGAMQELLARFVVAPWADGARVSTNCDPEVARTAADPLNAYDLNWKPYGEQMKLLASDPARATSMPCDGLYLDSLEGWESPYLNHRREHLALTDWPLTFDAASGEVGQVLLLENMEFVREAADRLQRRGHYLMANTALYRWCWPAAWLDVMGIETNWGAGEEITPPPLSELDFIRAMCGERPYCYLQNVDFAHFRGHKVQQYFARCLFHGMWPGFFSADAASHPYWENPAYYDADRPLFVRYMQPLGTLTEAGWRPLTRATSSAPDVLLERWGGADDPRTTTTRGAFYLSALNTAAAARGTTLTLAAEWGFATPPAVFELLDGYRLPVALPAAGAALGRLALELPAGESAALLVLPREAAAIASQLQSQQRLLAELAEKWRRHGLLDEATAMRLAHAQLPAALAELEQRAPALGEPYTAEAQRLLRLTRGLLALRAEVAQARGIELELTAMIVPDQPNHLRLTGLPAGTPLRIDWQAGSTSGTLEQPAGAIALQLPPAVAPGAELQLRVRAANAAANDPLLGALDYAALLRVHPTLELAADPLPLHINRSGQLEVTVSNHAAASVPGRLLLEGAASEPSTPLDLTLPPAGELRSRFTLRSQQALAQDARGTVSLRFTPAAAPSGVAQRSAELLLPITWLRPTWSALRDSTVEVTVDSTYSGYTPRPLTDGTTDTSSVNWSDAAWASDEGLLAHWVEFRFPQPRELRHVRVWWSLDGGHYQTSANVRLEGAAAGSEPWRTLGQHQPASVTEQPVTTFDFPPQPIQRLRVFQPAGGGPPARAGLLWLAEVEAE